MGILLIVVAEAPRTLTRYFISKQPEVGAPFPITPLRYVVDWGTLIRAAGGGDEHPFAQAVLNIPSPESGSLRLAREAIARLTGEEPLVVIDRYSRGLRVFDFPSEDEARGGQIVGEKIDGLNIISNKLRGSVNSDAALGHFEWEMTFQNDSSIPQEVRAEIKPACGWCCFGGESLGQWC